MSGRINYEPYDVIGVDDPAGQFIVGIGADYPDVVITGTRDQLIGVFREALMRLDA